MGIPLGMFSLGLEAFPYILPPSLPPHSGFTLGQPSKEERWWSAGHWKGAWKINISKIVLQGTVLGDTFSISLIGHEFE